MKKILTNIVIIILLSGCASHSYTNKPTLSETQEMYHKQKHPLKDKRITKVIFWYSTIFIMSYCYVIAMKK